MNIIDRIGEVLQALFPDITVYREDVESGFIEPSFFVSSIGTRVKPELFTRQKRTYSYQLVYFPKTDMPKADMERMQDLLLGNFLVLPLFATIRNREFQVVDGALTLTFDVVIRAYLDADSVKQGSIETTSTIKMKRMDTNGESR